MNTRESLHHTANAGQTEEVGHALGVLVRAGDVVSLSGPLGCGKTVFVKGMARALGVTDPVTSPSFVIVGEYSGRLPLYHMDLYRLDGARDLENLGFRDIIDSGGVTVIEWGEKARGMLPAERVDVLFEVLPDQSRRILVRDSRP